MNYCPTCKKEFPAESDPTCHVCNGALTDKPKPKPKPKKAKTKTKTKRKL